MSQKSSACSLATRGRHHCAAQMHPPTTTVTLIQPLGPAQRPHPKLTALTGANLGSVLAVFVQANPHAPEQIRRRAAAESAALRYFTLFTSSCLHRLSRANLSLLISFCAYLNPVFVQKLLNLTQQDYCSLPPTRARTATCTQFRPTAERPLVHLSRHLKRVSKHVLACGFTTEVNTSVVQAGGSEELLRGDKQSWSCRILPGCHGTLLPPFSFI